MDKKWRKHNMRIVSIPYSYCDLKIEDEWLALDSSPAEEAKQKKMLTEDEIRQFNTDFNYKHYSVFYEEQDEKDKQEVGNDKEKPKTKIVSHKNILSDMWNRVEVDPGFYNNYE